MSVGERRAPGTVLRGLGGAVRGFGEGELISAGAALLLLASMFLMDWFGVVGLPRGSDRSGIDSAVSGWSELTRVRWVTLLTVAVTITAFVLHASQRSHGTRTETGWVVTGLGALNAALLGNRVLLDMPAPSTVVDVKFGAFAGLLAAIGVVLGGYATLREERAERAKIRQQRQPRGGLPSRGASR